MRYLFRFFIFCLTLAVFFTIFKVGSYICCTAQETAYEYDLPVIMYHHILKDTRMSGPYIITPEEFEQDLKFIKDQGFTTISLQNLIDYKESGAPLPEKPILLTFDDGHLSYMEYAVPLLEKYNMHAVVSVVGAYTNDFTEHPDRCVSYAYLSWDDIATLSRSNHTEIGNHSYDMHKNSNGRQGCKKMKTESQEQHRKIFTEDTEKMQKLLKTYTKKDAFCFTYPFGHMCDETEEIIKELGFKMSLSCREGVNKLSKDSSLFALKRYNRPHGKGIEEILKSN